MGCKVLWLNVALLPYLMICEHVRAQCTQPSFGSKNVIVTESYLSTQSFPDGFTVTVECETGFKPVNSRVSKSVTCQGNQWTPLALECTKKSCGSPPDFDNGRYALEGILYGDKITAVCNTGYMLVTQPKDRWCRDQGWDGRDPACEVVKCTAPPAIVNGQLEDEPQDSYDYLQAVSYKCNIGFSLIGSSTLHCSEDGEFKPDPPICMVVKCTAPPAIVNGQLEDEPQDSYDYLQAVFYRCNSGLSLIGSSSIHCSENGTFKPDPPICMDGCPKPEIPHAQRIGGRPPPYKLNNFIDYRCDDGYTMKGADHITCTGNGWNPEPPKCIGPCSQPGFGGYVTLTEESRMQKSFPYGSKVTFECIRGYEPVNSTVSKSVTCEENNWTELLFTCQVVTCTAPPAIVNGQLEDEPQDSYNYLQAVSYKCNSGLSLIGSSSIHCSEDGTFKPDPPKCVDGCPKPEVPHASRIGGRPPPYKRNNFIDYRCDDGYTMKGADHIVCTGNGWNPEPPKCIVAGGGAHAYTKYRSKHEYSETVARNEEGL